ncbi:GGDEF domain-containing protein [Shewanella violacea]|uniref:GGDEF domain protein n=1 Tax=Shewanella violacea (strain JCM 10179 / CIP 106290 / LMG 19151 / DSS12) TaxID=637905 RepID=D4ZKX7_SHEVD|nr:GGDEF domain-containing protein [Shewanella violacea]BAJ02326.1 GGDEF domain protein [Shewanella violacea DSS12]
MKYFTSRIVIFVLILSSGPLWSNEVKPLISAMGEARYPYQFVDVQGETDAILVDTCREWLKLSITSPLISEVSPILAPYSPFGMHPSRDKMIPLMALLTTNFDQSKRQVNSQSELKPPSVDIKQSAEFKQGISIMLVFLILLTLICVCRFLLVKERSKRRQLESQLNKMANYDPVTGLANRSLLDDRLKQAMLLHSREQARFGLLCIDIAGLKSVYKKKGHSVGDKLVTLVTEEMSTCIRRSDTLARFDSNEFVVILHRTKDLDLICQVADTIISNLSKSFHCDGSKLNVKTSIGIAMFPADGDNAVELLKFADKLMYQAKQSGGNCYKSS